MGRHNLSSSCPQSASQRLAHYLAVYTFVPPRVIWGGLEGARNDLDLDLSCFCGSFWILIRSPIMSPSSLYIFLGVGRRGCAGISLWCVVFSLVRACGLSRYTACGLLAPRPGVEPCIGRWTPHYWTAGEVPPLLSLQWKLLQCSKVSMASLLAQRLKCLPAIRNPWVVKIPRRRKWQSTPVFLPGESYGRRSLVGYSPRGRKESDMTEQLK